MRFTIRDLLWLTVVVALGAGGWLREQRIAELTQWEHRAEILKRGMEACGLKVEWDGGGVTFSKDHPHPLNPAAPASNLSND